MIFLLVALFVIWLLISISIFNAMLLLWLGLTILLTAERRNRGLFLILVGMLLGALFFTSHTIILTRQFTGFSYHDLNLWWHIGWIPVIFAPLIWYLVSLWYAGYWDDGYTTYLKQHRLGVVLLMAYTALMLGVIAFTDALPPYEHVIILYLAGSTGVGGVPLLFILYPIFAVVCVLLSVDVYRRTVSSSRIMGDLARERSRPWLVMTAVTLLLAVVLVAMFFFWLVFSAYYRGEYVRSVNFLQNVILFDLLIAALIALVITLLGKAVVTYEVFTGKTLPRHGFLRQWRNAIILCAGIAGFISFSLLVHLSPIYNQLILAILIVTFYALLSWRTFVHRDYQIASLRPLVSSQHLMHHLIDPEDESHSRAAELFRVICRDMLGASQAQLLPLGSLSPLVGSPLIYPALAAPVTPQLPQLTPQEFILPIDPHAHHGLRWAIPLWAERGLIGVLLLGDKQDNGLYTQEEIDVARAGAERIVDLLAGEQMARRLMELQRRREAETRVLDLQTRRILHDEVLPTLHAALLRLSTLDRSQPAVQEVLQSMSAVHGQISDLIHTVSGKLTRLSTSRNLPSALREMVEDEFQGAFQTVTWDTPDTIPDLDTLTQDVLLHAAREGIRNAAVHGRGDQSQRLLNLRIGIQVEDGLKVEIVDDGVGLAYPTKSNGGSQGGLALHSTMLAIVGGYLTIEPVEGGGTRVVIRVPVDLPHPPPLSFGEGS